MALQTYASSALDLSAAPHATAETVTVTTAFTGTAKVGIIMLNAPRATAEIAVTSNTATNPVYGGLQEDVKIYLTNSSANHQTLVFSGSFNGRLSMVYHPTAPLMLGSGQVQIVISNKHKVGTIYVTAHAETVA